jgi:small subunit ribosomal protein S17e|tara:strand:- start:621 stop:809 length:189 start_codon:yes stop_codon:yes gene_type:complete
MGRIKTQQVKRVTLQLMKEHGSEFQKDFNKNKELVDKFIDVKSKKLRNVVAGYATRLKKIAE